MVVRALAVSDRSSSSLAPVFSAAVSRGLGGGGSPTFHELSSRAAAVASPSSADSPRPLGARPSALRPARAPQVPDCNDGDVHGALAVGD
eukprot:3293734-Alexandrium_andersonii.AAC.1